MLVVEQNVVHRFCCILRPDASPFVVQRSGLSSAFQRNRPGYGKDRLAATPVQFQKRCRVQTRRPLKRPEPRSIANPMKRFRDIRLQDPSNYELINLISQELSQLQQSVIVGDHLRFAEDLSAKLHLWKTRDKRREIPPLLQHLRQVYCDTGLHGLNQHLKYLSYGSVANRQFSKFDIGDHQKLADLRFPIEWYPATRAMHREIHLHVGPTNSGKTYHALKRMEKAESGIYAGPLRLLAHEIYSRFTAKGIMCNLITGDEMLVSPEEAVPMTSCTVEMMSVNQKVEVAVIDEIQMIGDSYRGWAWTQALLGVQAKEVHLCGEARVVPLIRELAALMGDKLKIYEYQRLSPLRTMSSSLNGKLENLRKGDCVVAFSRLAIHMLKDEIEKKTKKRVAVIYGSLPPETRAQQARLFNEPDNEYDYLVASDAIGMGLNLSIKRIIFETTLKYDGVKRDLIPDNHLKQIAGRAGRYRTATQIDDNDASHDKLGQSSLTPGSPTRNLGLVTSLERMDLPNVIRAMQSEAEPVMSAGILPPTAIVSQFASIFPPRTPFSYILLRLHELALILPRFHLCDLRDAVKIADILEPIKNLTINDKLIICSSPANPKIEHMCTVTRAFAICIANKTSGGLLDIPELNLGILNKPISMQKEYLQRLELLHKSLILYLWLSYRFAGVFNNQSMAFYVKGLVEANIAKTLACFSANQKLKQQMKIEREKATLRYLKESFKASIGQSRREEGMDDNSGMAHGAKTADENAMLEYCRDSSMRSVEQAIVAVGNDHNAGGEMAHSLAPQLVDGRSTTLLTKNVIIPEHLLQAVHKDEQPKITA